MEKLIGNFGPVEPMSVGSRCNENEASARRLQSNLSSSSTCVSGALPDASLYGFKESEYDLLVASLPIAREPNQTKPYKKQQHKVPSLDSLLYAPLDQGAQRYA